MCAAPPWATPAAATLATRRTLPAPCVPLACRAASIAAAASATSSMRSASTASRVTIGHVPFLQHQHAAIDRCVMLAVALVAVAEDAGDQQGHEMPRGWATGRTDRWRPPPANRRRAYRGRTPSGTRISRFMRHFACLLGRTDHVQRTLIVVVEVAGQDRLAAGQRFLQRHVAAGVAGERLGDEQRLRQEALQPAGPSHRSAGPPPTVPPCRAWR